jgi:NADPH:quinone reductase-like Zn-dependent oxidoreductase
MGANPIAVISSPRKAELVRRFGAEAIIDRRQYDLTAKDQKARLAEIRRMGTEIRRLTGGQDADVVFEHVGKDTFAASVLLAKRFGRIVICGRPPATSSPSTCGTSGCARSRSSARTSPTPTRPSGPTGW